MRGWIYPRIYGLLFNTCLHALLSMQVASRQRKLSKLVSERDRLEEAYRVAAMAELGMEEALAMANIEKARSATRGVNILDDIFDANRELRCCEDEIKQDKGDTPAKIVIRWGQPKITCMVCIISLFAIRISHPHIVMYTLCMDTSCMYPIARLPIPSVYFPVICSENGWLSRGYNGRIQQGPVSLSLPETNARTIIFPRQ